MASNSYLAYCPACQGSTVYATTDSKPFDRSEGVCIDCGWSYSTEEYQMTLDEVNEERDMMGAKLIKKLKKQKYKVNCLYE